jgi:Photosystem II complex subunit Ycf12
MINWQVVSQLSSLAIIVLVGPVVIVLLAFKRGNL